MSALPIPILPEPDAVGLAHHDRLRPHGPAPLPEVLSALVTPEPRTPAVPAAWSFDAVRPLLMETGASISPAEAERRVLILENPAMPGMSRITQTLYAGLQSIVPGEVASAHRHAQNALRFVMEGAFTALNGERACMHVNDLILTPGSLWHDHGNETDARMIWLDGLDISLVQMHDASFVEHCADRGPCPVTRPPGDARLRWGRNLRPSREHRTRDRATRRSSTRSPNGVRRWKGCVEAKIPSA